MTSLIPPGRAAYAFGYTPIDLISGYTPPGGANPTLYTYDADGQLTLTNRPDGQTVARSYDAAGRLTTMTFARGALSVAYDAGTGNIATIGAPAGINLAYGYDGSLLNRTTWGGPVSGMVTQTYDNDFRTIGLAVNGVPVAFTYDNDHLPVNAGALTLNWNAQTGLLTGTTLGNVSDTWTYSNFAEPANYSAKFGAIGLLTLAMTQDSLGRIAQTVETSEARRTRTGTATTLRVVSLAFLRRWAHFGLRLRRQRQSHERHRRFDHGQRHVRRRRSADPVWHRDLHVQRERRFGNQEQGRPDDHV